MLLHSGLFGSHRSSVLLYVGHLVIFGLWVDSAMLANASEYMYDIQIVLGGQICESHACSNRSYLAIV